MGLSGDSSSLIVCGIFGYFYVFYCFSEVDSILFRRALSFCFKFFVWKEIWSTLGLYLI